MCGFVAGFIYLFDWGLWVVFTGQCVLFVVVSIIKNMDIVRYLPIFVSVPIAIFT